MSDPVVTKLYVPIIKVDEESQTIKGVVYEPNVLDAHGDWMSREDIKKSAHRFMKELRQQNVDTQHNLQKADAFVCESYIAQANDPDGYAEGTWVVAMKIEDPELWQDVLKGEYGGLSMYGKGLAIDGVDPPSN